jgi:chaperonin GroES
MDEQETNQTPLGALVEAKNVAEGMDADKLLKIGNDAYDGYEADRLTRGDWEKMVDEWTKLAKQTIEKKSFPWPDASNVKYPILSTAAMQFAARAYPALIPSDGRVVKAQVVGKDPDGQKTEIAQAVSLYMSYQLMEEMDGWEEDMDRLLIMLPIVGTMFKKTYWDPIKEVNCSKVVLPKNLVVNYWAKSLREAERVSEILDINPRALKERQQAGIWLDTDLPEPSLAEAVEYEVDGNIPSREDDSTPYIFIEQHTYLDLDDDGYKEPYIVTFHKNTKKVFRIVARYDDKTMYFNDEGELTKIEPIQYYTKYGFVPNPDGGFYDIGFGCLLGPINQSVNTLINQLIDSGTMNNLQAGFVGKGLRLRMGETKFQPGEWKAVNGTGDDLRKQIVPLMTKEPSNVLFQLMEALISSGKELASVAEIFTGKMPGQNTPATTTMATVEQGMKVFTAVYKRIYRSMSEEFKKLYRLNGLYVNPNTVVEIIGMQVQPDYFQDDKGHKIVPGADPTAISQTEKLLKWQGLVEMLQMGLPLDPVQVLFRGLEAQEQPNWQQLVPQQIMQSGQMPPPPPDPKVMAMQMKGQIDQQKAQSDMQMAAQKGEMEKQSEQAKLAMQAQEHEMEMQHKQSQMQLEAASSLQKQRIFMAAEKMKMAQQAQGAALDQHHAQQSHQLSLQQQHEQGLAKAEAIKQSAKSKGAKKE